MCQMKGHHEWSRNVRWAGPVYFASMMQGILMRNQRSFLLNLFDDGGKAALIMRVCCRLFDNSSFAFGAFARTGGGDFARLHKLANI